MMRRVILALAALVLATGSVHAQLPVTEKSIVRKTAKLELDVHYPHTGRADIDHMFSDLAKSYAAGIQPNEPDPLNLVGDDPKGPNTGWMRYEIRRNDGQMFSIQIRTSTYNAGSAHGMPDIQSYNFLMPEATRIGLSDLVAGQAGLERVRDLAQADLNRQLQWDKTRLEARESWFSKFVWGPQALELTYAPYEVAGYAQGTLVVTIPLAKLSGIIRPDPRAPAASFDCAAARTRIETAICSDAELARLDRQMADKYAYAYDIHREVPPLLPNETPIQKLKRKVAQGYHDRTVAWQRDWLARRDKACASASVACLKASYRAHLREPMP
jgi:uncharacterized protein YecT (DUF1311 family)